MRAVGYVPTPLTENTDRLPSNTLWHSCPFTSIRDGVIEGNALFDDFTQIGINKAGAAGDTDHAIGEWGAFLNTGCTITGSGSEYGELVLTTDTTDNDSVMLISGGGDTGIVNFIAPDTAVPHDIWFEARFKIDDITTGDWYVGFAQPGVNTSDGLMTDTSGTYAAVDYVGFQVVNGDPDGLDFVYNDSGSSDQVGLNAMDTLVANTYVKAGLHYSYRNPADQFIRLYLNGQEQSTYVTKSVVNGANFPQADMCIVAMVKNTGSGAGEDNVMTLDWIKCAQKVN